MAFGTPGVMALAWKKLTSSLCLFSPTAQRSGVSIKETWASEFASSSRIDVLGILAGSWVDVFLPKEIAGGALQPTGIAKEKLALSLAGLKV